jgi:hypothetical protein
LPNQDSLRHLLIADTHQGGGTLPEEGAPQLAFTRIRSILFNNQLLCLESLFTTLQIAIPASSGPRAAHINGRLHDTMLDRQSFNPLEFLMGLFAVLSLSP